MQLLLTGSIAIDRIMVFSGKFSELIQPDKLHLLSLSVLLDELKDSRGGVAANISYTLGLLGEKPLLFGSVGQEARLYMEDLAKLGVDIQHVHYSSLPTATFTVMTDTANCQIGGFYPGAMSDATDLSIEGFKNDDILVVLSPHDPKQMATQVTECQKLKKRLFYDVGQQANNISGEDLRAGIDAAELLIVNDYEMGVIAQKTGWSQEQIEQKVQTCVTTLGEKGCSIVSNGAQAVSVSAVKVPEVIDPTGAGDAFRAGFLYGYVRKLPLVECAQLGSTAAAFAIEHRGAQGHAFTQEAFFKRHQQNYLVR
jgi:adenosine kinase